MNIEKKVSVQYIMLRNNKLCKKKTNKQKQKQKTKQNKTNNKTQHNTTQHNTKQNKTTNVETNHFICSIPSAINISSEIAFGLLY